MFDLKYLRSGRQPMARQLHKLH
jgi:hypothetical protein